jgi:hypothetical protein
MAYAELARPSAARPSASASLRHDALLFALLFAVALITRGLWIGDPLVGGDEQFYLLVGDRIWQGDVPYVDIWDRKPIGLFLIFAALRAFSGTGIVAYQVGALLFATSTAFVIARIATRLVALPPAALAGALYLLWLPVLGGVGGQSPVFYNLFMALAGLLVIKASEAVEMRHATRLAIAAMALVGLAMQVKYTAVAEGVVFGLWLVWQRGVRRPRLGALIGFAAALIGVALLPTAAATAAYALAGHGAAFVYANFLSIFLKRAAPSETINIVHNAILVAPLLLSAAFALGRAKLSREFAPPLLFLTLWSLAAIGGFFLVGHYYTHYALPMLVPLCVLAARVVRAPAGLGLLALFGCAFYVGTTDFPSTDRTRADRAKTERMVAVLSPYARHGCIYVNEGPTVVYLLTHSCLPTPYVFPEHLTLAAEAPSFDTTRALTTLLDRRPPAIVIREAPEPDLRNRATDRLLAERLAADYHLIDRIAAPRPRDVLKIFGRNDIREQMPATGRP